MAKKPNWKRPLLTPIKLKGGKTLRTLRDAANYVSRQPIDDYHAHQWAHAAELLMAAAAGGSLEEVDQQLTTVLWHRGMLDWG
ncbi:MAG TPA: hypothetical protein VNR11_16620 [Xanthobacteraceae bacterium]|nr:hypothetical protein [Xanthobacteraceae bacterium]